MDRRRGWARLLGEKVVNESRVGVDLGGGRVPVRSPLSEENGFKGTALDSPSHNHLLVRPRSIHASHQLGHRLVIIHIHGHLTLRLGMRQRETRPDLEFCDSTRSSGRCIGMSHAEEGTNNARSGQVRVVSGGSAGVVVEDLGEDRGVDRDSGRGSTGLQSQCGSRAGIRERAYGADADVDGRSR